MAAFDCGFRRSTSPLSFVPECGVWHLWRFRFGFSRCAFHALCRKRRAGSTSFADRGSQLAWVLP